MCSSTNLKDEITRCLSIEAESIAALKENLSLDIMEQIVKKIGDCQGRILVSGCGTSAMAARKVAHSLCCVECPAYFLSPADAVHGALGGLQKDDILILISKGGNTEELMRLINPCRKKGALLIAVTENENSGIAIQADLVLKVAVKKEPCRFNMLATASTLAVISAFDSICIALMQYTGYTREQFAIIHPGGEVGERLQKIVGQKK